MKSKNDICVKIAIYNGVHVDEVIYYRNKLPFDIAHKWRWYFEYIAALVKVHNKKRKVELVMVVQTLPQGQEYIEYKSKTLLRKKRAQLRKIEQAKDDCFFGLSQYDKVKKERLESEIKSLERGEFKYYIPETYINKIKQWIKR